MESRYRPNNVRIAPDFAERVISEGIKINNREMTLAEILEAVWLHGYDRGEEAQVITNPEIEIFRPEMEPF